MEVVFGRSPVLAALRSGRRTMESLLVAAGRVQRQPPTPQSPGQQQTPIQKAIALAHEHNVRVEHVSRDALDRATQNALHQGMALRCGPYRVMRIRSPPAIAAPYAPPGPPLWVALDSIHDPMNIGAIIRSACFFGAEAVVLCDSHTGPLSPLASKASAGALEAMQIHSTASLPQFLMQASLGGWQVIGTGGAAGEGDEEGEEEQGEGVQWARNKDASSDARGKRAGGAETQPGHGQRDALDGTVVSSATGTPTASAPTVDAHSITLHKPTILVVGNEGRGVRPAVQRTCHKLCLIPSAATFAGAQARRDVTDVNCLNVSVATAILLAQLTQSRARAS